MTVVTATLFLTLKSLILEVQCGVGTHRQHDCCKTVWFENYGHSAESEKVTGIVPRCLQASHRSMMSPEETISPL